MKRSGMWVLLVLAAAGCKTRTNGDWSRSFTALCSETELESRHATRLLDDAKGKLTALPKSVDEEMDRDHVAPQDRPDQRDQRLEKLCKASLADTQELAAETNGFAKAASAVDRGRPDSMTDVMPSAALTPHVALDVSAICSTCVHGGCEDWDRYSADVAREFTEALGECSAQGWKSTLE